MTRYVARRMVAEMEASHTQGLGAGYLLRTEETNDYTTRVVVVCPDESQVVIIGGYEHESPEDMTWERDLGELWRTALNIGIAIGRASGEGAG